MDRRRPKRPPLEFSLSPVFIAGPTPCAGRLAARHGKIYIARSGHGEQAADADFHLLVPLATEPDAVGIVLTYLCQSTCLSNLPAQPDVTWGAQFPD